MISIKVLAKQGERFILNNAPSILTAVGAVGAVGSVLLTGKAAFKSAELLNDAERQNIFTTPDGVDVTPLTTKDKVLVVWKEYIPAAGLLTLSVTSIVFSNRVSTRRAAAMAAAYSLSEKAYSEYREKVVEKFNANKERQIRDEIAQDRITNSPPTDKQILLVGSGDVICHDLPTNRYFHSNMEKLRSLQNDINAQVIEIGEAPLSDLYVSLGLKETPYSELIGWTTSNMCELHFSAVLTPEGQPAISINYQVNPLREGSRFLGCETDPGF